MTRTRSRSRGRQMKNLKERFGKALGSIHYIWNCRRDIAKDQQVIKTSSTTVGLLEDLANSRFLILRLWVSDFCSLFPINTS
jgi:hypothetical protein